MTILVGRELRWDAIKNKLFLLNCNLMIVQTLDMMQPSLWSAIGRAPTGSTSRAALNITELNILPVLNLGHQLKENRFKAVKNGQFFSFERSTSRFSGVVAFGAIDRGFRAHKLLCIYYVQYF